MTRSASRPRLHLRDGLRHQLVHLGAELRFGDDDALGGEIAGDLADRAIAAGLEIGGDDVLGVGRGGVAGQAELFGRPQIRAACCGGLPP